MIDRGDFQQKLGEIVIIAKLMIVELSQKSMQILPSLEMCVATDWAKLLIWACAKCLYYYSFIYKDTRVALQQRRLNWMRLSQKIL